MAKEGIYTVPEFATALKLKPKTIYNWITLGTIQVIRINRSARIHQRELHRLLGTNEIAASSGFKFKLDKPNAFGGRPLI